MECLSFGEITLSICLFDTGRLAFRRLETVAEKEWMFMKLRSTMVSLHLLHSVLVSSNLEMNLVT